MLCSGDMFKLYYRLVFVESSRLSWSTKVLTEAKNLGTFHIFKNSAILRKCCYGFKLSSPVSPREPITCADVIQLCHPTVFALQKTGLTGFLQMSRQALGLQGER